MNTFLTVTDPIAALLGPWSASLTAGAVVLRIALAAVLAAVIGWERSAKRHAAGLRTFLLVGLAAASAMLIDTSLSAAWGQGFPPDHRRGGGGGRHDQRRAPSSSAPAARSRA